jgi:hypothetical protein
MYGRRARIGRISPSPETAGAEEVARALPDGVCLVETRTLIHDVTEDGLAEMIKQVERAAPSSPPPRVKVSFFRRAPRPRSFAAWATTPTSSAHHGGNGNSGDDQYDGGVSTRSARWESGGRRSPRLTFARWTRNCPMCCGNPVSRIAAIKGLGIRRSIDMGALEPEAAYRLAREVVARRR